MKTKFLDEENSIKVSLISYPDVESTKKMIVNVCNGYLDPSIYDKLTKKEIEENIKEIVKENTLPKALEMTGKFVFLVENISLTITHCLVRHRFFTILQSSTAVKDLRDENFVMPRSFARDEDFYNKIKSWYLKGKRLYSEGVDKHGLSIQNARLLIPKNNCNYMFIGCDLKALKEAYGQRTCTQEEPIQHNIIFKKMRDLILEKFPYFEGIFKSHCETGQCLHTKYGEHTNVVFKRDELHSKNMPDNYTEKTLHNKTRDEMNEGPVIEEETYEDNNINRN